MEDQPARSLETAEPSERPTVPARARTAPAPHTLSHFEVGRLLGIGGMGMVFEARDVVLDRPVALKLMKDDRTPSAKARLRLVREGQALARLKHPNVVTVYEVGATVRETFIAMELLEGTTLREWMSQPRDWREVVDVFVEAGRGLAAAHALGLIHRDVKPMNIFLDRDGTPKIGDFGLVTTTDAADDELDDDAFRTPLDRTLTTTGSVMGTPAYMAPDQLRGRRADASTDQYAFCASLHEALTGVIPGERGIGRPLPPALRPILVRGLAARADLRFPSMDALLAELARARRARPLGWIRATAALAAVAFAFGAWFAWARESADRSRPPDPQGAIAPAP